MRRSNHKDIMLSSPCGKTGSSETTNNGRRHSRLAIDNDAAKDNAE